jgi:hypothetical protein
MGSCREVLDNVTRSEFYCERRVTDVVPDIDLRYAPKAFTSVHCWGPSISPSHPSGC